MNDFLTLIAERRTIRRFTQEKIKREDLLAIGQAARATATSVNGQRRKFTLVQNKDLIKALAQALGQVMGDPHYDFYQADSILLISSPRGYAYSEIETGLAAQNAYLAATALGIGMAWTDQIRNNCDQKPVRQVLNQMAIPSNHICWSVLVMGIPAEIPAAKERTEEVHIIE